MTTATILIVDDDAAHRSMLRTMLRGWGYATEEADDGESAVEKVRQRAWDAVLMDVRMARMDGIEALHRILDWNPATPVLIMTAFSSVDTAVEALRTGAYDYLTKPLDFDVLRHTLERALDHTRLASENRELRERLTAQAGQGAAGALYGIIGRSAPMRELVEMIATVAPSEATVLITGESGTGKELVARALHAASHRAARQLVTVNCAALTETLLESELFGHERGAFTGADRRREGRFVQADGGTLFLDEIGEMPLPLQAKLLRALQQGEVQRVGSDTPLTVDVRVIAATNRDLREEAAAGRFREDLYYRLNVITVHVPALRERAGDVPLLAAFFLDRYTEKNRKHLKGFSPQAMDLLLRHDWPGNVRELENAIERAVILATGDYVTERELPLHLGTGGIGGNGGNAGAGGAAGSDAGAGNAPADGDGLAPYAGLSLEDLERRAIIATLRETGDNKSEAARRLGITRATLHNKLKKYDLE
ncbi:sigma-54-dependent transcriptional regulator [Nitratidesulfovibrio sp. 1201_IL3209]|uniref:sigma-54-dependent transcriptional regulator n=1 Tax=Nitratidesulfovibrio sp. 1201_IL3209 TaxID=3084053 RepID=UPI002FDA6B8D